jgi:hypothetical protein
MPPGPDASPVLLTNPIFIDSESVFNVYVNNTEAAITPWDIRIKFREIVDIQGTHPVIKTHGIAVMAPAHAKAVMEALQKTIALYEDKFGEIELSKILAVTAPQPTSD